MRAFLILSILCIGIVTGDKLGRNPKTDDEVWDLLSSFADSATASSSVSKTLDGHDKHIDAWGTQRYQVWKESVKNLPICETTCEDVLNGSVILPPLSSRSPFFESEEGGLNYDWQCWTVAERYHLPPGCRKVNRVGTLGPEHLRWTTIDALKGKCRMPLWSPVDVANHWWENNHKIKKKYPTFGTNDVTDDKEEQNKFNKKMMTIVMFGASYTRGTFEAIACKWSSLITGGFVSGLHSIKMVRENGGSCHNLPLKKTFEESVQVSYPRSTHEVDGVYPEFIQNVQGKCTDEYACIEYGNKIRICVAYYGLRSARSPTSWEFCKAGLKIEDIDLLIDEQPASSIERDLLRMKPNTGPEEDNFEDNYASCRRDSKEEEGKNNVESGAWPPFPVLRLGTVLGLRPFVNDLAIQTLDKYGKNQTYANDFCSRLKDISAPSLKTYDASYLCDPPKIHTATEMSDLIKSTRVVYAVPCGRDPHDKLPGTPDMYAHVMLALAASVGVKAKPGEFKTCDLPERYAPK